MAIVAAAILALAAAFIGALQLSAKSVEVTLATQVGRDFLELVKEQGYDQIPDGVYFFDGRANDPVVGTFPPVPYPRVTHDGHDFFLVVRVGTRGATLKTVTVEVYWDQNSRVVFETYVYPGSVSYS